jgi:hypothetical protein
MYELQWCGTVISTLQESQQQNGVFLKKKGEENKKRLSFGFGRRLELAEELFIAS